jgi:hypothetical protein
LVVFTRALREAKKREEGEDLKFILLGVSTVYAVVAEEN